MTSCVSAPAPTAHARGQAELLAADAVKLPDGRLFFAFIQKGGAWAMVEALGRKWFSQLVPLRGSEHHVALSTWYLGDDGCSHGPHMGPTFEAPWIWRSIPLGLDGLDGLDGWKIESKVRFFRSFPPGRQAV